jgi:hypothetical protein
METSIFSFATDFHDEGLETVLDNVQQRAGLGGVTVAAAYHEGRDIFPHNPVHKVRFLEGGAIFFRPDRSRYEGLRIQPHVSELTEQADVVADLCAAAERRGLKVHAWTVFLHNDTLGTRHPDCAPRNAFGDPYVTDLCPANPDARAYVRALAGDIARLGVTTVLAESLHYHPIEHGYAHERYFIELGPQARYLLGLCFCEHCLAAARARGVDADAVRRFAREELEGVFAGDGTQDLAEVERDELGSLARGELGGYLAARDDTVTTLVREATQAAHREGETRFTFMDLSGAVKGYATGQPTGEPAPTIAWRLGVDLRSVADACDAVEAIGYTADPYRLRFDLDAYREATAGAPLSVALRPMPPDCDSSENLAAKVRLVADLGLERADFYHYGFLRLSALDWIQEAVRSA